MTTPTPQPTLKPCPFCGGEADPAGWMSTDRTGPACDECGASAETIERWNTRATIPPLEAEVERLRAALEDIGSGCTGRVDKDDIPCRIARAILAQIDGEG